MSLDDADRWEAEQFRREQAAEDEARWQELMEALQVSISDAKARRAREARQPFVPVTRVAGPVHLREVTEEEAAEQAAIDEYETSGQAWAGIFKQRPHEGLHFTDRRGA